MPDRPDDPAPIGRIGDRRRRSPPMQRNIALMIFTATALTVASVFVPTPGQAAGLPVLDTIALTSYLVDMASYNDHLSPMTTDEPRPSCYHGGARSAWYRITTSIKGEVAARLNNYRDTDIHSIALYRGTSFSDVVELGCFQFPPMGGSFTQPLLRAGESVYFQVIADGAYYVSAMVLPSPFIDGLGDAEDLPLGFIGFGTWSTEGLTVDAGEPLPCGPAVATGWLKYVPDQTGTVTIEILAGLYNDVLALYQGTSLADLQLLGCGEVNRYTDWDQLMRIETRVSASVIKGVTYYVQVGATSSPGGSFDPLVARGAPPANDSAATAIFLDETHHSVNATTVGALTHRATECGLYQTVWYRVVAPTSGTLEVSIDTKATGSYLYMPTGIIHRMDTGELLACAGDTSANVTLHVSAQAGASYLIAVATAGHPGDFRMHWEVK
jgi:hypothetical protein